MTRRARLAVVGGGWAGIAAAVEGVRRSFDVTLYEMAPQLGGRSRGVEADGLLLDNGQHILIGAYRATLDLMRTVGVDVEQSLERTPLDIAYPDGSGLHLGKGTPAVAFAAAVLKNAGWPLRDRLALLATAAGWMLRGFECAPSTTVAKLTAGLSAPLRNDLIDPLCIAALNTPAADASAQVFLRVLRDALFSAPGSADLLLPRTSLSDLLPVPAQAWLLASGATVHLHRRIQRIDLATGHVDVDGERFDHVVLATTPAEAARLTARSAPDWSAIAAALRYEPIVTVYLRGTEERLPRPMMALRAGPQDPAQFVFDRGQLGQAAGLFAFVISGASPWLAQGAEATTAATIAQARTHLGLTLHAVRHLAEKRATFLCTPGLRRPPMHVAPCLHAAGDYVDGPYPATLEGAVRSGTAAV